MPGVKNSVKYAGKSSGKNFYILTIIFILFSSVFPLSGIAGTTTLYPDLTIVTFTATPDPSVEGDLVRFVVTVENVGHKNITAGESITVSVFLDDEQTAAVTLTDTLGLKIDKEREENLTWVAALGLTQKRTVHVTVSYSGVEESLDNNAMTSEIQVNERATDLLFVSTPTISGTVQVGKSSSILASVKNIGRNTTQDVNVSLFVDRVLSQGYVKTGGLLKGETFEVLFFWTPSSFGTHTLNLSIDPKQVISEQNESNNYYEISTSVMPWWNASWHYRSIYNVTGTGNLSVSVNFTSLLKSLPVSNKTVDNTSLMVVKYYTNGTMNVVNISWFNESKNFNNRTNALGTFTWKVTGSSLYGVYFDVLENRGTRRRMNETLHMKPSGTVQASVVSTQGWSPQFATPLALYYPPSTALSLLVNTSAQAKSATARFTLAGQSQFNTTLQSNDNLTWSGTSSHLNKRGNWTVTLVALDDAGYQASISAGFYVGKPDLALTALHAPDTCYVGTNVTITANVRAYNTTVQHVNVSLLVDNIVISSQINLTIQKDENRTLQFNWYPQSKGSRNVTVKINFSDSNPKNNKRWKTVLVEGVPDLGITNLTVSPIPVAEGKPVTITARINNTGDGNATDYEVKLFCEQNENDGTIYFRDEVNHTTVSVKHNETTTVTLTWTAEYGKASFHGVWAVGVLIGNTTEKPDKHSANNRKELFRVLLVSPTERKPPVIANLVYPQTAEEGHAVLISAQVTDDSGLSSVIITIKNPNKIKMNGSMTPGENNRYTYLFETTKVIGRYNFSVTATDQSLYHNPTTVSGFFEITQDRTPPTIEYYGALPLVQLNGDAVEIRCITTDFSGIASVWVTIRFPDDHTEEEQLTNPAHDAKYVFIQDYEAVGKYTFFMTVKDAKGIKNTTDPKVFWVTHDLDDMDNDGIPDSWEDRYGLNPEDPSDGSQDADGDGVTNLEEYKAGTNPGSVWDSLNRHLECE